MFGWQEWVLILVVILLLFGAKRLPEMAQGLGKGIKEFRKAMKDTTDEIKGSTDVNAATEDKPKSSQAPQNSQPKSGDDSKQNG
ncbi:twin-arginine translocase TatA/TatE family subunit [candidate division GN15 bacterium]|nr:twin-arginine translocase TatA/TatE family subunit [candidate division GN15 bacterium]